MENTKLQIRGIFIRESFKLVLERMKSQEEELNRQKLLLKNSKVLANKLLDPNLLVMVSFLEEQINLTDNIKKLVEDVINLDWSREETELQFESMKRRLEAMELRNKELRKEANLIKEPSF